MEIVARLIEALRRLSESDQAVGQTCDEPKPIGIRKAYKSVKEIVK